MASPVIAALRRLRGGGKGENDGRSEKAEVRCHAGDRHQVTTNAALLTTTLACCACLGVLWENLCSRPPPGRVHTGRLLGARGRAPIALVPPSDANVAHTQIGGVLGRLEC